MDVYVLDEDFSVLAVVDNYTSFIWTDRYKEAGDFELYLPTSSYWLSLFKPNRYIKIKDSDRLMIIEDLETTSDIEEGNNLKVIGRSLESILDRRIVWDQTEIEKGPVQNAIKKIITDSIINPTDADRKISNFIFLDNESERLASIEIEAQYSAGDNIYDIITNICEDKKIGFKIILDHDNNFVFSLYEGTDRSYEQTDLPYVVFSPNFENIINSTYTEKVSSYKNTALVLGEGSGDSQKSTTITDTDETIVGLSRRETRIDANSLSTNDGKIAASEYIKQLAEKGKEELKKLKITKEFDGEVETTKIFVYGKDYFIGDFVELEDEYGRKQKTKIIEFIRNQDDEGYKAYPSFEVVTD